MRRLGSSIALLAIFLTASLAPCKSSRKNDSTFEIDRPTVIAFFPSNEKANSKTDDKSESLSDFQLYTASVRQPLEQAGADLEVVYSRSFQTVLDGKMTTFRPARAEPGYYFATPGKRPRIEYGVMSDKDILRVAHEYFGSAMK
jgi:hypothetical protein